MRFLPNALGPRSRGALIVLSGRVLTAGAGLLATGVYLFIAGDDGPASNANVEVVDFSEDPVDLDLRRSAPNAGPPTAAAAAPLGDAGYELVIEKIGVNASVSAFGMDEYRVPEVPYTATDVTWYDFSARPGTGGNAVFAGHVTWNGPAVF